MVIPDLAGLLTPNFVTEQAALHSSQPVQSLKLA